MQLVRIALLLTCREINTDATAIFYAVTNFVVDSDPIYAIRLFKTLPEARLRIITTITLPPSMLDSENDSREAAWDPEGMCSLPHTAPAMNTPFGTFLVPEMPKLSDIYVNKKVVGDSGEEMCPWALADLESLLCHRRIGRLHYLSMSGYAARILGFGLDDDETKAALMDTVGADVAGQEFDLRYSSLSGRGRMKLKNEYVEEHGRVLFGWKWEDRDSEMRAENVQAVFTAWLK